MTAQLSPLGVQKFYDNNGNPLAFGLLYSYAAGTTNPQATYVDSTQTTQNTNPVQLNFRGECNLWLDPTLSYKLLLTDSAGNTIPNWPVDNIPGGPFVNPTGSITVAANLIPTPTNTFTLGNSTHSWANAYLGVNDAPLLDTVSGNVGYYKQTSAESTASVTPISYSYPPQTAIRYATNTTPGTTDMAAGIQAAIDSAGPLSAQVLISSLNAISKPLLVRTSTQQSLSIIGNSRVSTVLQPLSASIATAPQNVNALIINQNNNPHLHLRSFEYFDNVAYTGVFVYCKEGGCADGSGQALFSGVFEDMWLSPSSNNTGCFRGGFSNLYVDSCTFESIKTGCFILEGLGNSDQQYLGCVMNACFDSFIYGAIDTQTKAMISVNGLHAYQHLRGPIIQINNGVEMRFNDITVESNSSNFGSIGLFSFQDCTDVLCSNFLATTANGEPKCATGITIVNGFTGKFSCGKIVATTGVQFSGTGALDITFEDVDFTGCDTAFNWLSGTLSGKVILRGCRLNNMQHYGLLVTAGTHSWDLYLYDCEIMNAGLSGTTTDRNMDLNTSGTVRLIRCKIGQDNVSAAAAFYIRNQGATTFYVIDPIIIGSPPTGFNTGNAITLDGVDSTMPGMPALIPSVGGTATYTSQLGRWALKNGIVNFYIDLTINVIGTGSQTTISGLPFTSSATYYGGCVCHFFSGSATNVVDLQGSVSPAGTSIALRSLTVAAAGTANNNILQNAARVILAGSYPL